MSKARTPIDQLFPSRLRLRPLIYDPTTNRYIDAKVKIPTIIVESAEQVEQIAKAIEAALAPWR